MIVFSISGEVGNGVECISLVDGIGGLVAGNHRFGFGLNNIAMTKGEVALKMVPRHLIFGMVFPYFAVIK